MPFPLLAWVSLRLENLAPTFKGTNNSGMHSQQNVILTSINS